MINTLAVDLIARVDIRGYSRASSDVSSEVDRFISRHRNHRHTKSRFALPDRVCRIHRRQSHARYPACELEVHRAQSTPRLGRRIVYDRASDHTEIFRQWIPRRSDDIYPMLQDDLTMSI